MACAWSAGFVVHRISMALRLRGSGTRRWTICLVASANHGPDCKQHFAHQVLSEDSVRVLLGVLTSLTWPDCTSMRE
ncbi:hypothetical protein KVV02_005818 [Mortierella alpina]|uniref:Uncharacterized protein n=1 Tax=Mortierella alpina TaxID=64518 RepID=A0A9P7ZY72_MORAP|nr:hypothetical protein KVV02_005818 [Mortierella alpina]